SAGRRIGRTRRRAIRRRRATSGGAATTSTSRALLALGRYRGRVKEVAMTNRRAEAEGVRDWDKGVAERNELDEHRAWVVWGVGATDERAADPDRAAELPGEPGNDIATEIARERDPDFNPDADTSWVRVVEADED